MEHILQRFADLGELGRERAVGFSKYSSLKPSFI